VTAAGVVPSERQHAPLAAFGAWLRRTGQRRGALTGDGLRSAKPAWCQYG
jgi:hypothetical protein